jgi:hypothetical protein
VSTFPLQEPLRFCYKGNALDYLKPVDRKKWPRASDEFVYAWEAIDLVGAALHQAQWLPSDLFCKVPGKAPNVARWELKGKRPASEDKAFWDRAQDQWDENVAAHTRLLEAVEWIGTELRNDRLTAYTLSSGGMRKVGPGHWFGIDAENVAFLWGKIGDRFVFLDMAQLRGRCASLGQIAAAPALANTSDLHLSPYMKMLLAVIEAERVTAEDQPVVAALEAKIIEMAPLFGLEVNPFHSDRSNPGYKSWVPTKGMAELSGKSLDVMPTIIREISKQSYRGG